MVADDFGGLGQPGGSLEFALGIDDLGPAFAFGLGLLGHGPLHFLGQVDVLELDVGHLDAPGTGVLVEDGLHLAVDLVAVGQDFVQLDAAADAAQGGLGNLGSGVHVVLHFQDGLFRINDAEIDHGVDLDAHIVPGDDVLIGHVQGKVRSDTLVIRSRTGSRMMSPGPLVVDDPAQAENNAPLIFVEHSKRGNPKKDHQDQKRDQAVHRFLREAWLRVFRRVGPLRPRCREPDRKPSG